jgi:hypothetical protein
MFPCDPFALVAVTSTSGIVTSAVRPSRRNATRCVPTRNAVVPRIGVISLASISAELTVGTAVDATVGVDAAGGATAKVLSSAPTSPISWIE